MRAARDIVCDGLAATGRVRFAWPDATFYLFCAVDGEADSRALALRLVDEAGVGVAPGAAFGPGGEGYLRLCFGRAPDEIAEATRRLARWLRAPSVRPPRRAGGPAPSLSRSAAAACVHCTI